MSNKEYIFKTKNPTNKDYSRFIKDGLINYDDNSKSNVKYDFKKMSKIFGLSYIFWLEIQYFLDLNDGLGITFREMCEINGNVPVEFFNKFKQ